MNLRPLHWRTNTRWNCTVRAPVCERAQLPFSRMILFFFLIPWNSFIGVIQVGPGVTCVSLWLCFNDVGLPLCLSRRSCSLWIRSFMRTYTAIQQRATRKHASSLWRRTACGRACCYCTEAAWRRSDGSSRSRCFLCCCTKTVTKHQTREQWLSWLIHRTQNSIEPNKNCFTSRPNYVCLVSRLKSSFFAFFFGCGRFECQTGSQRQSHSSTSAAKNILMKWN